MHFLTLIQKQLKRMFIVAAMALLLTGCPSLIGTDSASYDEVSLSSSEYLRKAEQSLGEQKVDYQVLAARAYLKEGQVSKAQSTIESLPAELSDAQRNSGMLVAAEIELAKRNNQQTAALLNRLPVNKLKSSEQARFYQARIQMTDKRNTYALLRDYIALEIVTPTNERKQNVINASWNELISIPVEQLDRMQANSNEPTLAGWLELARIYQQNKDNTPQLKEILNRWVAQNPNNPYSRLMPTPMANLLGFTTEQAGQVALLLPLSGQAQIFGQAIEAGFMAAMTEDNSNHVQVTVYDTNTQSVPAIIKQIESSNVPTAVIGPLLKQDVEQAISNPTLLDMLALNQPQQVRAQNNICYFALSPEDEAKDAARYMKANGHLLPLLIVPQSNLGDRVAKAFEDEWIALGGEGALATRYYNEVGLSESLNNRAGIRLTGVPVTPGKILTPGQEVDAVYILGNRNELTLIRAMINMEPSNKVHANAMYSSSRSNMAEADPDFRIEMEGLRFSEIPLLAGIDNRKLTQAMQAFNNDYSQVRLYALGMDAWKLANRFSELKSLPNFELQGYTGKLTTGTNCEVIRQLTWLEYQQGKIVVAQ